MAYIIDSINENDIIVNIGTKYEEVNILDIVPIHIGGTHPAAE
jgi:hypothetical protein